MRWIGVAAGACLVLFTFGFSGRMIDSHPVRAEVLAKDNAPIDFPTSAEVLHAVADGVKVKFWPAQPNRIANPAFTRGCNVTRKDTAPNVCIHGDPNGNKTVVVYGDSHGAMWIPAFDVIGKQEHWQVAQLTKPACPVADYPIYSRALNREYTECAQFRQYALGKIKEIHPDLVILTSSFLTAPVLVDGKSYNEPKEKEGVWDDGLGVMIDRITSYTKKIIVLGDMAYPAKPGIDCLNAHPDDVPACNTPRAEAVQTHHNAQEERVAHEHGAEYVDTIPWFCTGKTCPAVIGGLTVHREKFHISENYAVWLSQVLGEATGLIPQGAKLMPVGPSTAKRR
jgi:SGNH domain (fused to AT3 domains)